MLSEADDEKEEYRQKLARWREMGFEVSELERLLDSDFEKFKERRLELLRGQVHKMPNAEFGLRNEKQSEQKQPETASPETLVVPQQSTPPIPQSEIQNPKSAIPRRVHRLPHRPPAGKASRPPPKKEDEDVILIGVRDDDEKPRTFNEDGEGIIVLSESPPPAKRPVPRRTTPKAGRRAVGIGVDEEEADGEENPDDDDGAHPRPARPGGGRYAATVALMLLFAVLGYGLYALFAPPPLPTVRLTADSATPFAGAPVTFDGSKSTPGTGNIQKFRWDFGDGTVAVGVSKAVHAYAKPGDFTASLKVTDSGGGSQTAGMRLTVLPLAVDVPARSGGDSAGFRLSGTVDASNPNGLAKFTVPSPIGGPQTVVVTSVSLAFDGPSRTDVRGAADREDGLYTLHRAVEQYSEQRLNLSGNITATGPVPRIAFTGYSTANQTSYMDLTTNETLVSVTNTTLKVFAFGTTVASSADDLRSYLYTGGERTPPLENLYIGKSFRMGAGPQEGTFSSGSAVYTWSIAGADTTPVGPALQLKVTLDAATMAKRNLSEFTLHLSLTSLSSLPARTLLHLRGVDGSTTYSSDVNSTMQKAARGTVRIRDICTAAHYGSAHPASWFSVWGAQPVPPSGDDPAAWSPTAEGALAAARGNSSGLDSYLSNRSGAFMRAGNYTVNGTTGDAEWKMLLGEGGSKEGWEVRMRVSHGNITTDAQHRDDLSTSGPVKASIPSPLTLTGFSRLLRKDGESWVEAGSNATAAFVNANFSVRGDLRYPSVDLSRAYTDTASVPYAYTFEKGGFTAAYDARSGQLLYVWRHSGTGLF